MKNVAAKSVFTRRFSETENLSKTADLLAVEEPLEIRLGYFQGQKFLHRAISITMRTPTDDFNLAAGFLFTEGIIDSPEQISSIKHCGKINQPQNTVRIDLKKEVKIDFKKLERHFYTSSSCGVCGKTSIEALANGASPLARKNFPQVSGEIIHDFPEKIFQTQEIFSQTGGLHAAALFDTQGNLLEIKEDIGRHNAVDKLIGHYFLQNQLPLEDKILFLSGRAGFELVQKAVTAKIPIIAAVGSPSSLAVETAKNFKLTLLGFVRNKRFNVYSGFERINSKT